MKSFLKEESFLVQDDAAAKHYVSPIFDAILLFYIAIVHLTLIEVINKASLDGIIIVFNWSDDHRTGVDINGSDP